MTYEDEGAVEDFSLTLFFVCLELFRLSEVRDSHNNKNTHSIWRHNPQSLP